MTVGVGSTSALSFRYDLHSVRVVERETLGDGARARGGAADRRLAVRGGRQGAAGAGRARRSDARRADGLARAAPLRWTQSRRPRRPRELAMNRHAPRAQARRAVTRSGLLASGMQRGDGRARELRRRYEARTAEAEDAFDAPRPRRFTAAAARSRCRATRAAGDAEPPRSRAARARSRCETSWCGAACRDKLDVGSRARSTTAVDPRRRAGSRRCARAGPRGRRETGAQGPWAARTSCPRCR